jgi:DNA-directed RNA polymerase subunit RPC12/RpoP
MIEYATNRLLKNSSGKITGKIRILKLKEEELAKVEYVCPECKNEEKINCEWKKPFSIRCSKCNFLIKVPSLRYEIKKMRKSEKNLSSL